MLCSRGTANNIVDRSTGQSSCVRTRNRRRHIPTRAFQGGPYTMTTALLWRAKKNCTIIDNNDMCMTIRYNSVKHTQWRRRRQHSFGSIANGRPNFIEGDVHTSDRTVSCSTGSCWSPTTENAYKTFVRPQKSHYNVKLIIKKKITL